MANTKKTDDTPASAMAEIGKLLEQLKLPSLDLQAMAESQRKDMEALALAHQQAFEGMQALAERRSTLLKESLAQWQHAMQPVDGGDPLTQGAERAQQSLQQTLANVRELGEMEVASHTAVWQTVQERMQQNFADLQKLLQPR